MSKDETVVVKVGRGGFGYVQTKAADGVIYPYLSGDGLVMFVLQSDVGNGQEVNVSTR